MTGPPTQPGGVPLARLFSAAFTTLIEGLHERLTARGWSDVRPAFGYVLLAARERPLSVSEVARTLGVSKQAASQVLDVMIGSGYVSREADPHDARAKLVRLTERGHRLLGVVEEIYTELEAEWVAVVGADAVAAIRRDLTRVLLTTHDGTFPGLRALANGHQG